MRIQLFHEFFVVLLCVSLTAGCGGNSKTDTQGEIKSQAQTETEGDPELPDKTLDSMDSETDESVPGDDELTSSESSDMDLYGKFLAGEEKLDISRVDLQADASAFYTPQLNADETYTIQEFLRKFLADRKGYNDGDYSMDDLYYAYADCGQDGMDELILQFKSHMYNDEYNNIMVVKAVDSRPVLCAWFSDGYRSYNYINTSGVIAEGGSGGASNWYDSYYGIDENGDKYVIYESQTCGPYDLYMGAEMNPGEEASGLGVDDICITRYSFEAYPYDDYEDEHYIPFLKGNYYTYTKGYDTENTDQSADLYAAGSNYAEFMDMITDNWHTPEEMQDILEEKMADKRVTSEMLQEDDLTWTRWEGQVDDQGENRKETLSESQGPVTVCLLEDYGKGANTCSWVTLDSSDYQSHLVFQTEDDVTDLKIYSLSFTDTDENGKAQYDSELLYEQDKLTPQLPLGVDLTFEGDMSVYGITYTDANGQQHNCILGESGMDGSVYLTDAETPFA